MKRVKSFRPLSVRLPRLRLSFWPLLPLALSGCLLAPSDKPPPLPAHTSYSALSLRETSGAKLAPNAQGAPTALRAEKLIEGMDIPGAWWEIYQNPALNRLVAQALANSPNLKSLQHGLKLAWEQRRVEGAGLYPQISAQFMPSWNKTTHALSNVPIQNYWSYSMHTVQLQVGYVPDLWGGRVEAIIAAGAQADIQRFQLEATALTMIAQLVNAAILEAGLRAQIAAQEAQIAQAEQILAIMDRQVGLGDQSMENTLLQRNLLAQQTASLPPLKRQLAQNRDQMATLAGEMPNADLPVFELKDFTLPEKLPLTLPAQLLSQRPDVRAAQAQITAASAQVGIAIANRLPNLQLSATPGYMAEAMKNFFTPSMGNFALLASVSQPLFQGGSLIHAQRAAREQFLQSVEVYKNTVLTAVSDVADSLHAIEHDSDTLVAAQKALEAAQKTQSISETRHRLGDNSEIDVMSARFLVGMNQMSVAQAVTVRYSDTVGLFQSLGGGWWHRNDLGLSPEDAKRLSTSLLPW